MPSSGLLGMQAGQMPIHTLIPQIKQTKLTQELMRVTSHAGKGLLTFLVLFQTEAPTFH